MKRKETEEREVHVPQGNMTKAAAEELYYQMTLYQKVQYAMSFGVPFTLAFEILGAQVGGLALGFFIALATGYFSEEIKYGFLDKLPLPREQIKERRRKLQWWLTGNKVQDVPSLPENGAGQQETQATGKTQDPPLSEIDQLFQAAGREPEDVVGVQRLHPNDIIRNTKELDQYWICIGRSLTKPGNPPVWINIYCQHLKIIGASQYGKSSMAACILYLITRTHSPNNVRIALLDLEHKTSKLFTDCQHIAKFNRGGQQIPLHAKSYEEVLEHLGYCVDIMNQRYTLTEEEVEEEPLLIIYLEEFLDLKDYFKLLVENSSGEAKEEAKKNYSELISRVTKLARRALKVKMQLLLCAQVNYRDEDLREALVNIAGGMSFNVDPPAARAAGFIRTNLLKRNTTDNKRGQAVVETLDCKDLVLAPEYNLKKMLLKLSQKQKVPLPHGNTTTIIGPSNTQKLPEEALYQSLESASARLETTTDAVDVPRQLGTVTRSMKQREEEELENREPKIIPIVPEKGPKAEDIDLTAAIHLWNAGFDSERKLMKAFPGLTLHQAGRLRDRIVGKAQEALIE